ncbi:MAG: zinc-dependent metalloprotease, partial [Planctomycetota bacterium]|nr:zinc-dependent metalloprotease [Planctomycetota bacterium]
MMMDVVVRGARLFVCAVVMVVVTGACAADRHSRVEGGGEAQAEEKKDAIAEKVEGMRRLEGMLTLHLDDEKGAVWLETPRAEGERGVIGRYLYVEGLLTGLGSNPVGLDRGQLGETRVVALRRVGGRILVEEENLRFRAESENDDEREAVRQSFATSVLWAGEIEALSDDGRALVDFTSFIVRDAHDSAGALRRSGQGEFSLDAKRSAVEMDACLAFPENVELEAALTFSSRSPGGLVRQTAPSGDSVTLVQHHSLLKLPDDGYRTRAFDPRISSFAVEFLEYAAGLDEPIEKRFIVRHRLEKVTPGAAPSRVKEPIVYYVDRGAPEPVRSALVEGASWWAEAFEGAGFIDAYRVEVAPEGMHPLDARYNFIQWVHRSTRGWSYGGGVVDPRTGEMIKGHVSLGSLRVRQDRLIFEGLLGVEETGTGSAEDPIQLSLARIRQLSAHEVGHTLGFAHNFTASAYGGRASVMDYPAPLVRVRGDGLDVSDAYGVGMGSWDLHAARYAYAEFDAGADEAAELERIVREGLREGLLFISDSDARPLGGAHPKAHLWDNFDDAVTGLENALAVRRIAMDRFGEGNLPDGSALALLQEVFAPVYFHHRYQVEAAVKV